MAHGAGRSRSKPMQLARRNSEDANAGRGRVEIARRRPDGFAVRRNAAAERGEVHLAWCEKFYVRGATYGTFRRHPGTGTDYPDPRVVANDFARMAANGFNAVRTYTVPPRWLLDPAGAHGLRVMVGLPWEQHVAFLDDPRACDAIEERVRTAV